MTKKKKTEVAIRPHAEVVTVQHDPTPGQLIQLAIQKGTPTDQLEKLMDLQERWRSSIAKAAFNKAFARFHQIVPDLKKNKTAEFAHKTGPGKTNYQYQTLDDIKSHIRDALAECGLSYQWGQEDMPNGGVAVWCILKHEEGHEVKGDKLSSAPDTSGNKVGIQAKASAISYLRRYTLTGILGLSSADVDDDGHAAVKAEAKKALNDLDTMDDTQFKATLKQVISKQTTTDKVKKYYDLTEDQEKAFRIAEGPKEVNPEQA